MEAMHEFRETLKVNFFAFQDRLNLEPLLLQHSFRTSVMSILCLEKRVILMRVQPSRKRIDPRNMLKKVMDPDYNPKSLWDAPVVQELVSKDMQTARILYWSWDNKEGFSTFCQEWEIQIEVQH